MWKQKCDEKSLKHAAIQHQHINKRIESALLPGPSGTNCKSQTEKQSFRSRNQPNGAQSVQNLNVAYTITFRDVRGIRDFVTDPETDY